MIRHSQSRRIGAFLAHIALIVALLAGPAALHTPRALAQGGDLPGQPPGPGVGVDLELLGRLEEVALRVRGLPRARDIPVRVINREELGAYVNERVEARATEEESDQSSTVWKLLTILGMVEPGTSEQGLSDQTLTERVAGLYSPERKAMLIITASATEFGIEDQITFLHEYVHAL